MSLPAWRNRFREARMTNTTQATVYSRPDCPKSKCGHKKYCRERDACIEKEWADSIRSLPPTMLVLRDVEIERARQKNAEGFSPKRDDGYVKGELADAAASYVLGAEWVERICIWPWSWEWWKPKDRRRDLVRAAALIVAEIERLDRAEQKKKSGA
jgi:hypothetical protein